MAGALIWKKGCAIDCRRSRFARYRQLSSHAMLGWFAHRPRAEATLVPGAGSVFLLRITVFDWVIVTIGR